MADNSGKEENFVYVAVPEKLVKKHQSLVINFHGIFDDCSSVYYDFDGLDDCSTTEEFIGSEEDTWITQSDEIVESSDSDYEPSTDEPDTE